MAKRKRNQAVVTPDLLSDARVDELRTAFERVQNTSHWKNPIDTIITIQAESELADITEAVAFFTGSVPTFKDVGRRVVRVQAAGYYLTIGS